MGVDLRWEDERGRELGCVMDLHNTFSHVLLNQEWTGTKCIGFIDLYGDTIFNRLQVPVLILELTAVLDSLSDEESKLHVSQLIQIAEQCSQHVHTYLKFRGD